MRYILFYKPYEVLSQFSPSGDKRTLADFFDALEKDVYPVGRLDYDSEGLLLLTSDKALAHQLTEPRYAHQRTYYVQVEGIITDEALNKLSTGIDIQIDGKKHRTKPAKTIRLDEEPILPLRNPPIRFRKSVPTSWLSLTLTEGKNRQVRRMTAAVGFPTLRLVRYAIGKVTLGDMQPGDSIELDKNALKDLLVTL
jgi:23S rRNA pseudouridine2457 synthase